MADNITRSRGTPGNYKSARGGIPNEPGPFIGTVMNNHDPARIGRVQVYIPEFGSGDMNDSATWRTVRYMSPFFGNTPHSGTSEGTGSGIEGNPNSYGMWFTVPDEGVKVLCFFVGGDANQGYYVGSIPDPDYMHMVPAVGASTNYQLDEGNAEQAQKLGSATRLPVAEINAENEAIREDAQSYNQTRPVHTPTAATMYQQGVINDRVRGPVGSSAYRESPSNVFGILTPGRPVYASGVTEYNIQQAYASGGVTKEDLKVVGRRGGHSIIMDDGDVTGNDQLIRIRTAKGHQITLSDDGNSMHIMHANGSAWIELGQEGTLDVYATNSVNVRTEGDLNLHADQDVNIYAGRALNLHGKEVANLESDKSLNLVGDQNLSIASKKKLSLLSDGTIAIDGTTTTSINSDGPTVVNGSTVELNTRSKVPGTAAGRCVRTKLGDVEHTAAGWVSTPSKLDSIVTRAPTHEPFADHNKGVVMSAEYDAGSAAPASDSVNSKLDSVNSNIGVRNS
jgi:hypothetical protein